MTVDMEPGPGELFLIIDWPSAETFHNQAGGRTCAQPSMRGLLLPLHLTPQNLVAKFLELADWLFVSGVMPTAEYKGVTPYGGWCSSLRAADADALDPVLRFIAPSCLRFLEVDRHRLGDSMEAWIHVFGVAYLTPDGQPVANPSHGPWNLVGFRGVLTWENSD